MNEDSLIHGGAVLDCSDRKLGGGDRHAEFGLVAGVVDGCARGDGVQLFMGGAVSGEDARDGDRDSGKGSELRAKVVGA